jgi:hypothetical protein
MDEWHLNSRGKGLKGRFRFRGERTYEACNSLLFRVHRDSMLLSHVEERCCGQELLSSAGRNYRGPVSHRSALTPRP